MKLITCILCVALLFSGCSSTSSELDAAMELRHRILTSCCSFTADITANCADELYNFRMDCSTDSNGTMTFSVTEPISIAGITGTISADNARLTFDEAILSFPPLSGGKLTPVTGPWIFINTLRSGYLSGCGKEGEGFCILADDSYADNALHLEILTDSEIVPVQVDIFWNQQRILTILVSNFIIL